MSQKKQNTSVRRIGLLLGPIAFLLIHYGPWTILDDQATGVIAIAIWMVIWWMTEAVSISVTALIPITLMPLFGLAELKSVANSYGHPIVFLFFGGFVMALALEKVQLHRRIALNIIKLTGTTPDRVILGFMLATALLSMWISNTATTVVMLPIAVTVIDLLKNDDDGFTQGDQRFALSLMLGIAFSANVGGLATIIGTPPNTVMIGYLEQQHDMTISFAKWMSFGLPLSMIMLAIIYLFLVKVFYPNRLGSTNDSGDLIQSQLDRLGPVSKLEWQVIAVFAVAIFLWIFRLKLAQLLPGLILSDAGISLLAAFSLFCIPAKWSENSFVLEWKDTQRLPWGILILFGGGLALATALSDANIVQAIGESVSSIPGLSLVMAVAIVSAIVLFMTELMSNVALIAIFCPVIAGIALGMDVNLLYLIIPATIASSCAFMLPMATPPNAIVFASGYIKVHEMARVGVILNVAAIVILILLAQTLIPIIF